MLVFVSRLYGNIQFLGLQGLDSVQTGSTMYNIVLTDSLIALMDYSRSDRNANVNAVKFKFKKRVILQPYYIHLTDQAIK